jgi:hypothetical protein
MVCRAKQCFFSVLYYFDAEYDLICFARKKMLFKPCYALVRYFTFCFFKYFITIPSKYSILQLGCGKNKMDMEKPPHTRRLNKGAERLFIRTFPFEFPFTYIKIAYCG